MKKTIRLNEGELKHIIEESVKHVVYENMNQILNEKFENNNLAIMVKQHGGLDSSCSIYDMRSNSLDRDPSKVEPLIYLPVDIVEKLRYFDWHKPIEEQVLLCKDGGIIVAKRSSFEADHNNKIQKRSAEYLNPERWDTNGNLKLANAVRKWHHVSNS